MFTQVKLINAAVAVDSKTAIRADVEIKDGHIARIAQPADSPSSLNIDLNGYLVMPGLINAHDHLEFNLFPRLGNGPYKNSREWADDIYQPERSPLREHRSVPRPVRLWWGGLKNLLSGVTTVSHHNPYDDETFGEDFPVQVVKRYGWAHSLVFDDDPWRAFASTPAGAPFIIHLGEGSDTRSRDEIFVLDRLGALDERTVLVHGVGLNSDGHALRRRRGAALVWCPTSNRFTLGATLKVHAMSSYEDIALGSDSALTAKGDLLDEVQSAYREERVGADAIYRMVTKSASAILRLRGGQGTVRTGAVANLIALRSNGSTPAETLVSAGVGSIELVMVSGRPHLLSAEMAQRWPEIAQEGMEWIRLGGTDRMVRAPVRRLLQTARNSLSGSIRLAGKEVSA
jgi:cytosine/adenosine deaminase-related metal-dependent hydrolase